MESEPTGEAAADAAGLQNESVMRAHVQLEIEIVFAEPARALTQVFRLKPRSFESQHVLDWRVCVTPDALLRQSEDSFGNIVHSYSNDGPLERLTILSEGEIDTSDAAGVLRGTVEKFPLDVFLRDTDYTHAGADLLAFAGDAV